MKVLMISARGDFGGGPEHLYQLTNKLVSRSEPIDVFAIIPKDEPYWEKLVSLIGEDRLCEIPHRKLTIYALVKCYIFCIKNNFDIIHTHGKGAGIYGRLLGLLHLKKLVHTPHGIHVGNYSALQKQLYIYYENLTSIFVNMVCFVSTSEKRNAEKLKLWSFCNNSVIPNGVEIRNNLEIKESRKIIRSELSLSQGRIVIVMISRFDFSKNMQEAYEIAKLLPKYDFLWIGDGVDKKNIENIANKEQVTNIIFTGFSTRAKDLLIAGDIYLTTSRWEGMPLGVLEAMSLGLPVVASNVAGNQDVVIHNKTGELYSLGNHVKAAKLIEDLANNPEKYLEYSRCAKNLQSTLYSLNRMADQIANIYDEVLSR